MNDIFEQLKCAEINFENAEKMMPLLKEHPIFQLAKLQLNDGIKLLEKKIKAGDGESTP